MAKLLIIGKMPPPIGGVAMHVKRLDGGLRMARFDFHFCDPGKISVVQMFLQVAKHRIIHIHFSNPAAQLAFAVFCRLACKKLIITYHGSWGRYRHFGNWAVRLSACLAYVPVVQDRVSLSQALRCNPHARRISTYISDRRIQPLPPLLQTEITARRRRYQATFCTNAWNVTFDKNGREIYGISELISRFAHYPEYQLLVSDPSGRYATYTRNSTMHIPGNLFFISHLHDFKTILLHSDAFIRNTTTDGVSLSIHEAREFGIPVLASAAVERPPFCSVFQDFSKTDLKEKLEEARRLISMPYVMPDTMAELIGLYREVGQYQH